MPERSNDRAPSVFTAVTEFVTAKDWSATDEELRNLACFKHVCILCDSNQSISIDSGAAGVWPIC